MLSHVRSGAVLGVDALLVRVEVDIARGLPCFHVVGLPESAVREGRERVSAALANSGFALPSQRITVNLAPADLPKAGSAFDLPIALAILAAMDILPQTMLQHVCAVGELGLDGSVRTVRGVLSIAARCAADALTELLVPRDNAGEAAVVSGVRVIPIADLRAALAHLQQRVPIPAALAWAEDAAPDDASDLDYLDVRGQETAKRALEVAAAGHHNVLMVGPPGTGKSMLARRLPGILAPLAMTEAIETTKVYSVAGRLRPGQSLLRHRPFRAPHHTVSDAGMVGGGNPPRPGEVSLAHHGVLFLDELPEFRRHVLDALRQPLEDHVIQIGRARASILYPARFMLIAAMNPCPCGYHGTGDDRCVCHPRVVERYRARISGPLLDRIDLHIHVAPVDPERLRGRPVGVSSAVMREHVRTACERQVHRYAGTRVRRNAELDPRGLRRHCRLDAPGAALLHAAVTRLGLSARAYHRVVRVARTIADLNGDAAIAAPHIAEAIQYRSLDRGPVSRPESIGTGLA